MPKSNRARIERILLNKQPKINENPKKALIIKGTKTSKSLTHLLSDIGRIKNPDVVKLQKHNPYIPFDNMQPFEFLSERNDCSLFLFATTSKKRPDDVVMGRFFDNHVLDMFEFGMENYVGLNEIKGIKAQWGHRPMFIFQGEEFENNESIKVIKNIILDFFHGKEQNEIDQEGLDFVIVCSYANQKIYFRTYCSKLNMVTAGLPPKVVLIPQGPNFEMTVRRSQFASEDLVRQAYRQPRQLKPRKIKNVKHTALGDKVGTIHMDRQDFDKLETRKIKGLKRKREEPIN